MNKNITINILVSIVFIIFSLFVAEFLIRLFIGPPSYFLYTAPFTEKQNNWEISYKIDEKTRTNCSLNDNTKKFAVIGDSFVFGQGVDNCNDFVSLLNVNSLKYDYENYGLIGVGITEYIMVIRDYINNEYEGVLIVFYGNDISDFKNYKNRSLLGVIANKSSLLSLARKYKRSIVVKQKLSEYDNGNKSLNNVVNVIGGDSDYFYNTVFPGNNEMELFEKQFAELTKTIRDKNIKNVYISVVPNGENLSPVFQNFIIKNGGKTASLGKRAGSYDFIKELSLKNGFTFIDTFEQFSENSHTYYFENDLHWTNKGHKLMSQIVSNYTK